MKQIRQELKEVYSKCTLAPSLDKLVNQAPNAPSLPTDLLEKLPPGFALDPNTQTVTKPDNQLPENDIRNENQNVQQNQKIPGVLAFRPQTVNIF